MPPWGAKKSLHSAAYDHFLEVLRRTRVEAGLTQAELGRKIGRPHNWVSKSELGERRMDVTEFAEFCRGCGADPTTVFQLVIGL